MRLLQPIHLARFQVHRSLPTHRFALVLFALALLVLIGPAVPIGIAASTSASSAALPSLGTSSVAHAEQLRARYGTMPLYFIENQGQLDARVGYYLHGHDTSVYFTPQGVTYALTGPSAAPATGQDALSKAARLDKVMRTSVQEGGGSSTQQRWAVAVDFVGANPDAMPRGEQPTSAVVSYFRGSQTDWKAGVPTFASVRYDDLWPGIDLVYEGTNNHLKYTFLVRPGADPRQIKLAYRGATDVALTATGQLEVRTPVQTFREDVPSVYQEENGQRTVVSAAFARVNTTPDGSPVIGFTVGAYDTSRSLVLDPVVFVYVGYIGGTGDDFGYGIAVDGAGNAYVTGYTSSGEASFPIAVGPDVTYNGGGDAFVVEVKALGTSLVYAGYIGGINSDRAADIALDANGSAYVAGDTASTQATFPVTAGPDLTYNGGFSDAFVAKVKPSGTGLAYAGYIGGADTDEGDGIAVNANGAAYVAGTTSSTEKTFPIKTGPDLKYNGGGDAFVTKIAASGTSLVYSGYIGGNDEEDASGIAVDTAGNAYVTGSTLSDQTTFPVAVGPDLTYNGGLFDAFVAKVGASGMAPLIYCGYIGGLGGFGGEGGNDIAVDGAGSAYVVGNTPADQTTFPVKLGPDITFNGDVDGFIAKVRPSGASLAYAGYIGGSGTDAAFGVAVDKFGSAYVTGETQSDETTFPVKTGPDLTYNGSYDAFVAKIKLIVPTPFPIVIKPGSPVATINPQSQGMLPVAILSTDEADATLIDPQSVRFGASGTEAAPVRATQGDVDGDGLADLLLLFGTQETGIDCGDTSATLTGRTLDGQSISRSAAIRTVGCPREW